MQMIIKFFLYFLLSCCAICMLFYNILVPKPTKLQVVCKTLLKEVDKIFTDNNITYWAVYGTLLGAIRHEDIIPWDDDIDIACHVDDFKRIITEFELHGLTIFKTTPVINIYKQNGQVKIGRINQIGGLVTMIDLFLYENDPNDERKLKSFQSVTDLPYFWKQDLTPCLTRKKFGNMNDIPVPHNCEFYLSTRYGENWKIPIHTRSHHARINIGVCIFVLSIALFTLFGLIIVKT